MATEDRDAPAMEAVDVAQSRRDSQEQLLRLLGRIALRDPAAFAQLYDATVGPVYALALRILRDVPTAEEVVSDVYMQAWRTAPSYCSERGSVATWLLVICRSRSLDALRARDEPVVFVGSIDEGATPAGEDPLDLLAATQRSSCVHKALAALAPMPRQLIALAFFRGYTHEEIATFTGLPLGSVKSLIRRALAKLRESTREHEEP